MNAEAALRTMAANMMAVGARGRTVVEVGPFRAYLSPSSDDYLLSFAAPAALAPDGPDWAKPIADLRAVFAAHGRVLRLEFFAELHPGLGPALTAAGIARRDEQPAMAMTAEMLALRSLARSVAFRTIRPGDSALMSGLIEIQQVSFGVPLEPRGIAEWRRFLCAGICEGTVLAAVALVEDRPAACAYLQIGGGAAELVGVAARPGYRRRGLASGLCSRLLAGHFAQGHRLVWLSAGDPAAGLVYRRLGFKMVGLQLNHGLPPRTPLPV